MEGIQCSEFTFYNGFDSANLAKVVYVPPNESVIAISNNSKVPLEVPDAEFNVWTKPDCCGTEFENGNRTWFYFGVKSPLPSIVVRLNVVDLNRQGKMYSQGMAPVYRVMPGKMMWERIRDKPIYNTVDDIFTLSYKFKTPENVQSITYFAFTYPFSYIDLQKMLINVSLKFENYMATYEDDIYYLNEVVCHSLGGRDVNLLTISSYHGITPEMETRLKHLFPEQNTRRPFKFMGKKVIFLSARVHPGETPSSFVFNGFLNLLLTRDDPVAIILRRLYVFKLIPFLNPDGVALGHYRTDTRGVNLNRVYLNPLMSQHPPIYAARALVRYYHYGCEKEDVVEKEANDGDSNVQGDSNISTKVSHMTLEENEGACNSLWCMKCKTFTINLEGVTSATETHSKTNPDKFYTGKVCKKCKNREKGERDSEKSDGVEADINSNESGLFLYLDLHGHASKKGIFMYGNHFEDLERNVECMLLPKLMSINNYNFHFTACNFTERNMYLKDKRDGMSREGSGRVAVLKLTGLIKSYTLECNYNTGRLVNVLPPTIREGSSKLHTVLVPPKYTPQIFEEVGKSIGASILDLTGQNPYTRIPNSEFHTVAGLKDWLRINCAKEFDETRSSAKFKMRSLSSHHNQGKTRFSAKRPLLKPKRLARPSTVPIDRKENLNAQPSCSYSSVVNVAAHAKSFRDLNKTMGVKAKMKKEFNSKMKRSGSDKKIAKARITSKIPRKVVTDQERIKLREICMKEKEETNWKVSETFAKKEVGVMKSKSVLEAGPSKSGTYIVHNFGKNSMFPKCKFKKHSLRRLVKTSSETSKGEKGKKRKKLKSK